MKLEKLGLAKFAAIEKSELNQVIGGATTVTSRSFSFANGAIVTDTNSTQDVGGSGSGTSSSSSVNGVPTTDS